MPLNNLKLKHVTLRLIGIVLTFTVIFSALLIFGIFQNNLKPKETLGAGGGVPWTQNDWSGGQSASTATVTFGGSSWNQYLSISGGVTIGTNAVNFPTSPASGEFDSSILDLGTSRTLSYYFSSDPSLSASFYVRGASTASGVSSATWLPGTGSYPVYPACLGDYQYIQYKVVGSASSSPGTFTGFTMYQNSASITGTITDSKTGSAITGATITLDTGVSTTTAFKPSKNLIAPVYAAGGPIPPGVYFFDFLPYNATKSTYTVTVSKSGYNTASKTVTISGYGCGGVTGQSGGDLALSSVTSPTPQPPTSPSTNKTITAPPVSTPTFQQTKLPSIFFQPNSETTDLSKVSDPTKVTNFTIEIPGKNKVVFEDTLDLSSQTTVNGLKSLDNFVKIDQPGTVDIDSISLPALNKRAKLTMEGLKFISTPAILVNGKVDGSSLVSNLTYDKNNGQLQFDVAHFTTYTAATKIQITSPTSGQITTSTPVIKGIISDPSAIITGTLNGVSLANIQPNKTTGEFTISGLVFKEGSNTLLLTAAGPLGNAAPLTLTLNYAPNGASKSSSSNSLLIILVIAFVIVFLIGVGLVVVRLRGKKGKPHSVQTSNSSEQNT